MADCGKEVACSHCRVSLENGEMCLNTRHSNTSNALLFIPFVLLFFPSGCKVRNRNTYILYVMLKTTLSHALGDFT